MTNSDFSVAIFPYLKTSAPVRLGRYMFRSTTDLEGLPPEQSAAVEELAAMLFFRDDLRINRASYAIAPALGVFRPDPAVLDLGRVRTVVAYLYSSPHPTFGDVFFSPENVSLVVVKPAKVSIHLVREIQGATHVGRLPEVEPDKFGNLPGYEGAYNTRAPLWLTSGSRLYGPKPQMTLNIAQDMAFDLAIEVVSEPSAILLNLLTKEPTPFSERILTALDWYNSANEMDCDGSQSLLHLSVAFETLLQLPASEKTERLSDAISLLLGRTERLKEWAVQFYNARSAVAHSGRANDWWFYAGGDAKQGSSHPFGNLMTYGRQVFQLCVKTILVGADLAEQAGLKERFIANSERYELICQKLATGSDGPEERLHSVARLVDGLGEFRFVPSGGLTIEGMISAVRLAAATLLEAGYDSGNGLALALKAMAETARKDSDLTKLSALERLAELFKEDAPPDDDVVGKVVASLVGHAWNDLFMTFYRLQQAEEGPRKT